MLKHINEINGEEARSLDQRRKKDKGQSSKWFKVESSKQVSNEHDRFNEFLQYILFSCHIEGKYEEETGSLDQRRA